jgi:hypothetical protein
MSAKKIDHILYRKIFDLVNKKNWLEVRDGQLIALLNICTTERQQELIFDLVSRFHYSGDADLRRSAEKIAQTISRDWKLSAFETRIVAIADRDEVDGSQFLTQALKQHFVRSEGWNSSHFLGQVTAVASFNTDIRNVVLIDDFIGTGKKISRKHKWVVKKLAELGCEAEIFVCSMASMEASIPVLEGLEVKYFSDVWLKKGISDHFEGDALANARTDMIELESKLQDLPSGYKFGYKGSESIFYQEPFNVPNNVFPIFWWGLWASSKFEAPLFNRGA